jgi:hypothetical protein
MSPKYRRLGAEQAGQGPEAMSGFLKNTFSVMYLAA